MYQLDVEYPILSDIEIKETFDVAVAKIIASYQDVGKPI